MTEPLVPAAPSEAWPRRLAWLLLIAALAVRFPQWTSDLKIDEDATLALHDAHDPRAMLRSWRDHPLASLSSYAATRLLPLDDYRLMVARIPSLLAGAATVMLLYAFAWRHTQSIRAALVPALYLMFSSEHILFSTSVRGFALQSLGALALHEAFLQLVRHPSWKGYVAYGAIAVLMLWSHLFGVYLIAAHCCLAGACPIGWRRKLTFAATVAVAGCLVVALFWSALPEILAGNRDAPRTRAMIWEEFRWAFAYNTACFRDISAFLPLAFVVSALASWRKGWTLEIWLSVGVLAAVPLFLIAAPPGAFGTRYVLFYAPLFHFTWALLLGAAGEIDARWMRWEVLAIAVVLTLFLVVSQIPGIVGLTLTLQQLLPWVLLALVFTRPDMTVWRQTAWRWTGILALVLLGMYFASWLARS